MQNSASSKFRAASAGKWPAGPGLRLAAAAALVCTFMSVLTANCFAKHKASAWQGNVQAETPALQGPSQNANAACDPLLRNVNRHIESLRVLNAQIASAEKAPPSTVVGALEGLIGQKNTSRDTSQLARKADSERKTAAELNALLATAHCQPVDIDHELSQAVKSGPSSPVLPKRMPDLLPQPSSK